MTQAGWEQQQECERERWQLINEALDAACEGKASPEQIKLIARECGIMDYNPHRGTNEQIQPY